MQKITTGASKLSSTAGKGKELLGAINKHGCEAFLTGKSMYWLMDPNKIPDWINFFIIKNISAS